MYPCEVLSSLLDEPEALAGGPPEGQGVNEALAGDLAKVLLRCHLDSMPQSWMLLVRLNMGDALGLSVSAMQARH